MRPRTDRPHRITGALVSITLLLLGACADDPDATNLTDRVSALRAAGDLTGAITAVRQALSTDPENAELYRLSGALHLESGDWTLAEIAFRKALSLGAAGTELQLALSRALFRQKKFTETLALLESLTFDSNLHALEARIRLAKALDETGDDSRSGAEFAQLIKQLDRNTLAFADPINIEAVFAHLEQAREGYPTLDRVLDNRERLRTLPVGEWVTLHKQRTSDPVFFSRQDHGGSTFDTRRGRLVLFGSDTHGYQDIAGKNWTNNIFFFDPLLGEWTQTYPLDSIDTYTVNAEGIPVAGDNGDHPWAMHTYGAVSYDAKHDQVVISSHPAHLVPGMFTWILEKVWPGIRRHPTWVYDLQSEQWRYLEAEAESFFQNATVYDPDREVIIGYRDDGIFELGGSPRRWKQVADGGILAPDNNLVYDEAHRTVVLFGGGGYTNDIVVYEPATGRHEKMPTPGLRPPGARHVPMAFHPGVGKSVMLVQRIEGNDPLAGTTETWLYDLGKDTWEQVTSAGLDMGIYRNYNLEYDPFHDLLLFIPNPYGPMSLTRVMALRLE